MVRKITHEEAVAVYLKSDFDLVQQYLDSGTAHRCMCRRCGSKCTASYTSVRQGKRGCKKCKADLMRNARILDSEEVDKLFRDSGMEPLEPYLGASKPRKSRCLTCGKIGTPTYTTLRTGHLGCKDCGYKIVKSKQISLKRDLKKIEEIFSDANLEPLEEYSGALNPRRCRCLICKKIVSPVYGNLQQGQGGCIYCAAKLIGENQRTSQETANAVCASKNITPLEPFISVDTPRACKCNICGKTSKSRLKELVSGHASGCRYCGYRQAGENKKLDEKLVDAIFVSKGLQPMEPYRGASIPRLCECTLCGNEVRPQYASLKSGQGGCRYCAKFGIDYKAPGILYLMKHQEFQSVKVGISSTKARKLRIPTHIMFGWELIREWSLDSANTALTIETIVISKWRNELGAPPSLLPKDMPQGGASETAALLHVDIEDTANYIDRLVSELDNS